MIIMQKACHKINIEDLVFIKKSVLDCIIQLVLTQTCILLISYYESSLAVIAV